MIPRREEMLFGKRVVQILFEAVEDAGFSRSDLTRPLGLDPFELVVNHRSVDWSMVAVLGTELWGLVDRDEVRLRAMGRRMTLTQPLAPYRSIARNVVSVRALYEITVRWWFWAILPELKLSVQFVAPTRLCVRCEIPEPYRSNPAFFPLFEGAIQSLPELIGRPVPAVAERAVTERTLHLVLELEEDVGLVTRARRAIERVLEVPRMLATVREQRQELSENIRALQTARDELRAVLDRLPDFVIIQTNGVILWGNQALAAGLGYESSAEFFGMPVLDIVAPQSRAMVDSALAQVETSAAAGGTLRECVLRGKHFQEVTIELAPVQSVVFEGIQARLMVGRDITERLRMQQKLIVADRLASVGLLAAGVAHEVNNPLGYILNNIELARKDVSSEAGAAERRRIVLTTALEGVDRIRVIVRDLLMLSRGDDAPLSPIDIGAVASSTLALAAPEIGRAASLVCEFGSAPLVVASSARISQVLLNLVGNALDAMRDRPTFESRLVVRTGRARDGRLLLEVSDTGAGIAEGDVQRIFEPFFTTKASSGRGTGLGLAIVQRIVVELGGEIAVTSTMGHGTTFRVLLPAFDPNVDASTDDKPRAALDNRLRN